MKKQMGKMLKLLILTAAIVMMMSLSAFAAKAGWSKSGSRIYYYQKTSSGSLVKAKGLTKIGSDTYLFSNTGVLQLGWKSDANGLRYFKKNGKMGKGLGKMFKSKLLTFDNKKYAFDANGYVMTGYKKISGSYYYFSTSKKVGTRGAALKNKWVKINGLNHYFGATGKMMRNTWIKKTWYVGKDGGVLLNTVTPDGYQVGSNGKKMSKTKANGWITILGKQYYYSQKKGRFLKSCFVTISGKKYYVNAKSMMTKGWAKIGASKYYFDPSSGVMQKGIVTIGSDKYLLSDTGKLLVNYSGAYNTDANGKIVVKPKSGRAKVLIVAGHGQGNIGATSGMGYKEYIRTREFAQLIYNKMKADNKVDVTYYKNGSTSYDLYQQNRSVTSSLSSTVMNTSVATLKTALSKNANIPDFTDYDYVIEVHFNATVESLKDVKGDGKYKGIGFFYNSNGKKSLTLEKNILSKVRALGFNIWAGAPVVSNDLLNAKICARLGVNYALLETAFIDDRDDMNYYLKNKTQMADAVAVQIENYYS